ncbi:MAG: hypothetical protein ABR909_02165 [Candidatus Bathyarchaeia archaeon]|jgi:hypothetical protein
MAIASGDQNPLLLTVTGTYGVLNPVDPVDPVDPVGVAVGVAVGVGAVPWVTVNVAVATPVDPVAVIVYVPGDTDGTVNSSYAIPIAPPGGDITFAVPTFVVSKVMLTEEDVRNPFIEAITVVPAGPVEGLNVMDWDWVCAFAIGVIITAKVNMLRKSRISVALLNLFSISIKHFCNAIIPLQNYVVFS